jgi:signal transduction histidine kinase
MLVAIIIVISIACSVCILRMRIMQEQIEDMKRENSVKTAFLTKFSKELDNPLRNINKQAEIITRPDLYLSKTEKKMIFDQIIYNTNLITTFIDECCFLSGSGKGREVKREKFSPNVLCTKCIDTIRMSMEKDDTLKIVFNREIEDTDYAFSDPRIVELILDELLINSCRFSTNRFIRVTTRRTEIGDRFMIIIEDTGSSIPKDRIPYLFHWFDNPEDARDDAEIDLSIIFRLALKIDGYLEYDPAYTEGTRMKLIF